MFGLPPTKQKGLMGLLGTMPMNEANPSAMSLFQQQPAPMAPHMQQAMAMDQQRPMMPQQPKGPGINWMGVLADALSGAAGQTPMYAQRMMLERQDAKRQQMAQQERQQGLEDWQAKEIWKRNNPEPINNDTEVDFNFYKGLSPEDKAIYDQQHPVIVQGPDGPYLVPRSSFGGLNAPVGGANPTDLPAGYKVRVPGGPTPQASGSFPVRQGKPTGFQSYQSGSYGPLEEQAGREFGVPPEMLYRVRTRGERSNANQVSEVGARSVYQVTPTTRQLIIKQYGFDPWSSPQNAARGASIVLRDMYRKFGNWDDAMTGYHGGGDTSNWGPRTRAYRNRTSRGN